MKNPFEKQSFAIRIDLKNRKNIKTIVVFLRSFGYRWITSSTIIVPQFKINTIDDFVIYLTESKYLLYSSIDEYLINNSDELLLSYEDILTLMEKCNYEIPS